MMLRLPLPTFVVGCLLLLCRFASVTNAREVVSPVADEVSITGVINPIIVEALLQYELPVSIRNANYYSATFWNCVVAYSTTYRDTLTKQRPVIFDPDESEHHTQNRAACVIQAGATLNDLLLGGINNEAYVTEALKIPLLDKLNVTTIDKTIDESVWMCGEDVECLKSIAANSEYDPKTMGHIVAYQSYLFSIKDGFNYLGTDGGCVINCRAFSDTTGYSPVGQSYSTGWNNRYCDRWTPLTEDDGRGFFFDQQHVTPHIGTKAKFRFLPESDRQTRVVRKPNYSKSRQKESDEVIRTMTLLDDYKKVQVEAFDDKFYVNSAIIGSVIQKLIRLEYEDPEFGTDHYVTLERVLHLATGITATEYDTIVIAWKEKVATDLIRPTSVIKRRGEELITTWAPGGIQTFPARDFEAYIRVMPHSEYTSGSSCLFTGLSEYFVNYMELMGIGPELPVTFPAVPVGGSKVEPGTVPSSPITLTYASLEQMNEASGQSRIDGGMHFVDSVPAGVELCTGIGKIVAEGNFGLLESTPVVDDEDDVPDKKEIPKKLGSKKHRMKKHGMM